MVNSSQRKVTADCCAPVSEVPGRQHLQCDLPDVINCQFCEFAAALLKPVHFMSPDQQSGIHCLIICAIQLLTPNNLAGTSRRICTPDIRNVSALEVLRNCAIQTHTYLPTYLLTYLLTYPRRSVFWQFYDF